MNRRQRKKALKKQEEINALEEFTAAFTAWAADFGSNVLPALCRAVKEVAEAARAEVAQVMKTIREMPEEDFNRIMDSGELTQEQKRIAWKIRFSEKEIAK